jgi:uncharacterized LabA/DUF88 family protein
MKKIVIFIDGSNFNQAFRQCRMRPDYDKLTKHFAQQGDIVGQYYFTALSPERTSLHGVMDHIAYHGWDVVSKETKVFDGQVKGNMDVEIVVQAWRMWEHFTDLVLFSGDGDFSPMVSFLRSLGRRVTAVSIHKRGDKDSMIADELRRAVNEFIDLREIADKIRMDDRPLPERKPQPEAGLSFLRGKRQV